MKENARVRVKEGSFQTQETPGGSSDGKREEWKKSKEFQGKKEKRKRMLARQTEEIKTKPISDSRSDQNGQGACREP